MSSPFYRAWCKQCGATVKTGESSTFLDQFFLPQRCPGCHTFHSKYSYPSEPGAYAVEYGFWKFVFDEGQPPFNWFDPRSWFRSGQRIWVNWDEDQESSNEPS